MTGIGFAYHERQARVALGCLRSALEDADLEGAQRHHTAYGRHLAEMSRALEKLRLADALKH